MGDIKKDPVDRLERKSGGEGDGRDPTARRGDIESGGSVDDSDAGVDELQRKAIGGYGGDTGESVLAGTEKPLNLKEEDE